MQTISEKRKFETEISDSTSVLDTEPRRKLSRHARYNRKKRRLREEALQAETESKANAPEITSDCLREETLQVETESKVNAPEITNDCLREETLQVETE